MLGLRIDRLVHAAVAGGGLTLGGCPGAGGDTETESESDSGTDGTDGETDGPTTTVDPTAATTVDPTGFPPPPPPPPADITPPALIGIELLDPQILRLSFTEAIAPTDTVNPKRFRLSLGRFYEAYYGYDRTVYSDPEAYNREFICVDNCYYYQCYEQCYYGPPIELDVLDLLPDAYEPSMLIVLLEQPVTSGLCNIIDNIQGAGITGGLLLHYAEGGSSQITDLAGLPLASTGSTWVKLADQSYHAVENAIFPEQNPLLPIPCPF